MPGGFHPPLSVIATWPKPNYVDPVAKGHELLVVTVIFGLISVVFVVARLWARFKVQKNAGLDDLFIALALIPTIGITALFILIGAKYRWNRHIWDVPLPSISGREYHSWIVQLLFVLSTSFSKISTLLLYRRIMSRTPNRLSANTINCALIIMILYCITFILLMVLQCRPTESYWLQYSIPNLYTKKFQCMFEGNVPIANAVVSVITDFLIGLLPIYLFWHLHVPSREKVVLRILFGVGFLVCIMGIVRTVLVHHIFYKTYDVTWYSHDLWIWTNVENDLLIICSSVPPLRALFRRFFGPTTSPHSEPNTGLGSLGRPFDGYRDLANGSRDVECGGANKSSSSYWSNSTMIRLEALEAYGPETSVVPNKKEPD